MDIGFFKQRNSFKALLANSEDALGCITASSTEFSVGHSFELDVLFHFLCLGYDA